MFSGLVNRLKCGMSVSDSRPFKFWLISNVRPEYRRKTTADIQTVWTGEIKPYPRIPECGIVLFRMIRIS